MKHLLQIILTLSILSFLFFISCDNKSGDTETESKELPKVQGYNPLENSKITVEVFKVDSIESNGSRGWGYDIMVDGKLYIHQPNIPAVMGNNGFLSEEKARQAGEFIVDKIRKNILPPSVTPEELDSLGLLD
jgi:hypothetical protein